jgi:hypothetical protein
VRVSLKGKAPFKPLENSLKNDLNTVFEGLGTQIGIVAQAAQICGQKMSEESILDLQGSLLGVFNLVLTGVADREIDASKFVSIPVLHLDSTEYSADRPSKKTKTDVAATCRSDGDRPVNYLINFDHASAVAFLSNKYPAKHSGIIEPVARFFIGVNQSLILHFVVKNSGSFHRGFKLNPASSLNEEERKLHHLRCAWYVLTGCAVITNADEAFSLFFNESRSISNSTKENFESFYFNTMHHLHILKKKPALSTAFLDLSRKEVAEFKEILENGTYFSENEDSENDDVLKYRPEELREADVIGLGFEDELDEAAAKAVLPGNATEENNSVEGADILSFGKGDAVVEASTTKAGIPATGGEKIADGSEKEVQAEAPADGEPMGDAAAKGAGISVSGGGTPADKSKANEPDRTHDTSSSPSQPSKKQKVRLFSEFILILIELNTKLANFCVLQ